ncbi:carotenoid oxygenase family protein [Phenylobacterium sp.]|jgi:carotenoid cleavage dioxygenase|uniref:carotenoid oxygenase family protein n=1 Tax=Phenylobacterium sp. TaxID=1871053 RepID=UPI002E2F2788|nr:carotenoid oxygenase family protein [Phenylobacterium sp.]HEX2561462.1 carotenoid oxygenase family protein [Phenylobacterium sp.]
MDGAVMTNPYLRGNFAPVRTEDDFELAVTGEIPEGLRGTLYRNGPNPQFEPRDPNHHWFLGDGMIHAFRVEDGKVVYRNRYVRTPKWTLENAAGRSLFGAWGNPMTTDRSAMGQDSGAANTNIVWHAGRLLALEEGHMPFELAPGTLDPRGYAQAYGGRVTAHPKIDPVTGEMVWFAYSAGETPLNARVAYGVTDAKGEVVRRDVFEAPYASMVHDFLVTERFALFPILPLTGSIERAMSGRPAYAWEPEKGAFVGVMRRDADVSTIRWFNAGPCYVFHPMNAWEEGEKIHADVMRYERAPLFPNPDGSPGRPCGARLVRWTFDLAGGSDAVVETPLEDLMGEFPRFDERRAGLPYRHGWYAADTRDSDTIKMNAIAHIDLQAGRRQVWELPAGDFASEPVFTPRTADAPEGEGWLTTVIYRGAEDRSDFVVLDAQDVARGPIATAALPRRVPFGFHGNWVPG